MYFILYFRGCILVAFSFIEISVLCNLCKVGLVGAVSDLGETSGEGFCLDKAILIEEVSGGIDIVMETVLCLDDGKSLREVLCSTIPLF